MADLYGVEISATLQSSLRQMGLFLFYGFARHIAFIIKQVAYFAHGVMLYYLISPNSGELKISETKCKNNSLNVCTYENINYVCIGLAIVLIFKRSQAMKTFKVTYKTIKSNARKTMYAEAINDIQAMNICSANFLGAIPLHAEQENDNYKGIEILPHSNDGAVKSMIDDLYENDYSQFEIIQSMGTISKYNYTYFTTVLAEDEGKFILTYGKMRFDSLQALKSFVRESLLNDDGVCNESTWDITRN